MKNTNQEAATKLEQGKGNYHNCQQYRGTDDPPVIHVYVLSPAPEKENHKGKDQRRRQETPQMHLKARSETHVTSLFNNSAKAEHFPLPADEM